MNISYTNYNGDTVNFTGTIKWNQLTGLGAETVFVSTQNPFGDGETVSSDYLPSKRIQMNLLFLAGSEVANTALYQETMAYLNPKLGIGYLRFQVSGVYDSKLNCYLESHMPMYDLVSGRRVLKASVSFYAPDPYFYDVTPTVVTLSGHSGGLTIPLVIPLVMAAPGAMTCTNSGNTTTPFLLEIVGKCTNPTLYNADTGEVIQYTGTINAGETLRIYTKYGEQYATLDGVNVFYNLGASTLFLLNPGLNNLTYYAFNESIGSSATLTFSSTWDSI